MKKASQLRNDLIKGGASAGRATKIIMKARQTGQLIDDEPRELRPVLPGYASYDKKTQQAVNKLIRKMIGREERGDDNE